MRIKDVRGLQYQVLQGADTVDFSELIYDSRKITPGCLFVCMKGSHFDSHEILQQIAAQGAAGVIVEHPIDLPGEVQVYLVENTRAALSLCAAAYFGYPGDRLIKIGITGTKGKTTTACMIRHLLQKAGKSCGMIGTLGIAIEGDPVPHGNTTPESYEIQKAFAQMVEAGCEYCVMEVSSQAYLMHRVAGIHYEYALFTNIYNDHIGPGEHKNFEEYLACKTCLLQNCDHGFLNRDMDRAEDVMAHADAGTLRTFGMKENADDRYGNIRYLQEKDFIGIGFDAMLDGKPLICEVAIPGTFNAPNAMGAICICNALGLPRELLAEGLRDIFVSGRMELVYSTEDLKVIVDFAHNEVSARSILETLRSYHPKRLVVLFGCGGNRSPERRYGMGRVCGEAADFSIITEDNNRLEPWEDIIRDIHSTFDATGGAYIDIPLRTDAVKYAIRHAMPGDIVAIIGKGHENTIEKEGMVIPYTDQGAVRAALEEWRKENAESNH